MTTWRSIVLARAELGVDRARQVAAHARSRALAWRDSRPVPSSVGHRRGRYVIDRADDGRFRFTLHAGNGHVIATSASYESRADALRAIDAVRRNALTTLTVDRTVEVAAEG